jgi:hypothetical protein
MDDNYGYCEVPPTLPNALLQEFTGGCAVSGTQLLDVQIFL